MAQLLAPYNNSMRLGQGFNSYTQQICLDRAVLPDTAENRVYAAKGTTSSLASKVKAPKETIELSAGLVGAPQYNGEADSSVVNTEDEFAAAPRREIMGSSPRYKQPVQVLPWVKPQIVTYSSRFVDKLSDVTDAMNISGSLSIKTATIGGKANGSYVDSDKFKASDINFHLQVKVTNQIHDAQDYTIFNKIESLEDGKFPEIYGDTFISGWEEGGELNAILSMKVTDKSKIFEIKAQLEAEMTTPSISGKVKAKFEMAKNSISKDTETTIAVNWSGGGSIKDPAEEWSISTLKRTAASFPDLVAITPQRTYAILTRYTSLEDFHRKSEKCSPLDYENAGIYTASLLDHYMDYKSLWKQISHATYELEGNRASIEMAQPTIDIYKLATTRDLPTHQVDTKYAEEPPKAIEAKPQQAIKDTQDDTAEDVASTKDDGSSEDGSDNTDVAQIPSATNATDGDKMTGIDSRQQLGQPLKDKFTRNEAFNPTFAGLIAARKVCRFEMAKIVNEVDLVAKNPKLSTEAERDSYFLNPLVFKQLLPVMRSLSPENAILGVKDPRATLILGYSAPAKDGQILPPVCVFENTVDLYDTRLRKSAQDVSHKAEDYRMMGSAGQIKLTKEHSSAVLFNDLDRLDPTFRPVVISAWSTEGRVRGIQIIHSNDQKIPWGACHGTPTHSLRLADDGSEIIVEFRITEATNGGIAGIASFRIATSQCRVLDTSVKQEKAPEKLEEPATGKTRKANAKNAKAAEEKAKADEETKTGEEGKTTDQPPSPPALKEDTNVKTFIWSKPDDSQWSLRGFFGFVHSDTLLNLGIVWGRDNFVPVPNARISSALCKDFLSLSPALMKNLRDHATLNSQYLGKFLLGRSIEPFSNKPVDLTGYAFEPFNSLDEIDLSWKIKTLAFSSKNGKLCGIETIYENGQKIKHGICSDKTEMWRCDLQSDLVVAKITTGKIKKDTDYKASDWWIDTVEFVRGDDEGRLPTWPLYLSTLRYLGEGDVRVKEDVQELVEAAPTWGNTKWSIRGFYGIYTTDASPQQLITRLGIVWGRG